MDVWTTKVATTAEKRPAYFETIRNSTCEDVCSASIFYQRTYEYEKYIGRSFPLFYKLCILLLGFINISAPDPCGGSGFFPVRVSWILQLVVSYFAVYVRSIALDLKCSELRGAPISTDPW